MYLTAHLDWLDKPIMPDHTAAGVDPVLKQSALFGSAHGFHKVFFCAILGAGPILFAKANFIQNGRL